AAAGNQGDQPGVLGQNGRDQEQCRNVGAGDSHRKVSWTCLSPRKTSTTNLGFCGSIFLGASSSLSFFSPVSSCQTRGSSRLGTLPRILVVLPRRARAIRALITGSSTSEFTGCKSGSEYRSSGLRRVKLTLPSLFASSS